ncbi:MAG: hypothetical protein EB004_04005, partial [Actinobacteria bacterium]|nr:hypothetical protein [Actinomycetota bacterium]
QEIRDFLASQVGNIMQVPTKVSAIKINGQRAYDLVREGKAVDIPARQVEIYKLDVIEIKRGDFLDIEVYVECSAGTYIRSIARDLGSSLGVGGHLISLRRGLVAPFSLSDCSIIGSLPINFYCRDFCWNLHDVSNLGSEEISNFLITNN